MFFSPSVLSGEKKLFLCVVRTEAVYLPSSNKNCMSFLFIGQELHVYSLLLLEQMFCDFLNGEIMLSQTLGLIHVCRNSEGFWRFM